MQKCPICKNKAKLFCKKDKYVYYQCKNCITLFIHPQPTSQQLDNFYKQQFVYTAGADNETLLRQRSIKIVKKLRRLNPKGKRILDIGSGYGFFLEEAKKIGLKTKGIEPSKQIFGLSKHRKLDIKNLNFDQFTILNKEKYDFITLIHVIEHVGNPQNFLKQTISLLNPGGILYLETPNLDSHLFYSEQHNYTFLTPPDHLWLFSKQSFLHYYLILNSSNLKFQFSTYSLPEHFMGILKNKLSKPSYIPKNSRFVDLSQCKVSPCTLGLKKRLKYLLFDKLLAQIFTSLLNFNGKGSLLELYISEKS